MAITNTYLGGFKLRVIDVEIQSGASVSDLFEIPPGMALVGMLPPVTWTAADIAFKVSALSSEAAVGPAVGMAGSGYIKCAITAGVPVAFPTTDMIGWPWVQLLSCTANNATDVTPVNQAAKRTIRLVIRSLFN